MPTQYSGTPNQRSLADRPTVPALRTMPTDSTPDSTPPGSLPSDPPYMTRGSARYRRASIALFCAGFGIFSMLYCVQPLLPLLSEYWQVTPAQSSLSVSVTTAALAFSIIGIGMHADRVDRKVLMSAALMLGVLCTFAVALSPSWPALIGLRLLEGVVLGGAPAVAMAYLAEEVHAQSLGFAMGLYVGGTAIGGMSGRVLTGLAADFFGWRVALGVAASAALIAGLVFVKLLPPSTHFNKRQGNAGSLFKTLVAEARNTALLRLLALAFLVMGSFVSIYNYASFRLGAPPYSLSQTAIGAIFVVYLLGSGASTAFGRLADRFGRRPVLLAGASVMAAGVLLTLSAPLALIILGIAVMTVGFFGAHSVASATVGRVARGPKAQAASLYLLSYYLGSSVLGSLGGTFYRIAGWPGVVGMVTAALLLAVVTMAWPSRTAGAPPKHPGHA
nr:MFS transporter [Chitinasiproducens palmae]